jgi:hypothetical protein
MAKTSRLVVRHLEDISAKVLEERRELIQQLIRKQSGVYALYKNENLYYVGLASNLMGRLKTHLRDSHNGRWNRFSVYITSRNRHMKELESLILRIVDPKGNKQTGKFSKSNNLHSQLNELMRNSDADKRAELLGGNVAKRRRKQKAKTAQGKLGLAGMFPKRTKLWATRNGREYTAWLRQNGQINFKNKLYDSPTAAAKAAMMAKLVPNGWAFWRYRKNEKWIPLSSLRR